MERLTEKGTLEGSYFVKQKDKSSSIIKLGILEDIEEGLGCPIEVVFKALKNGIWTYVYYDCEEKENKNKLKHIYPSLYFVSNFKIDKFMFNCGDNGYYSVKLKDYKKTWWLKEDRSE